MQFPSVIAIKLLTHEMSAFEGEILDHSHIIVSIYALLRSLCCWCLRIQITHSYWFGIQHQLEIKLDIGLHNNFIRCKCHRLKGVVEIPFFTFPDLMGWRCILHKFDSLHVPSSISKRFEVTDNIWIYSKDHMNQISTSRSTH